MKKPRQLSVQPVNVEILPKPSTNLEVLQNSAANLEIESEIVPGIRGATFIPSVSEEGIISWTNDGDLPNPDPMSIKGPKGDPTTVNGKTGESITLTAKDVGALSLEDFDLIDCGTSTEVV